MSVASLREESRPNYETISYCWGDDPSTATLLMNGHTLEVPISSAAALRRMRLTSRSRVLWIDAICINQPDLDEKSTQVAKMSEIYRFGTGNLVYLGEDEENIAEVQFSIVKALVIKDGNIPVEFLHPHNNQFQSGFRRHAWTNTDTDLFRKLTPLYRRPWFR